MECNGSGWSSPERGAAFGIVSYDWSNAKKEWAAAKPMDCEKRLQTQARMTKAAGGLHVFVYRNVVKALPWFASVREKLDDPAYSVRTIAAGARAGPLVGCSCCCSCCYSC